MKMPRRKRRFTLLELIIATGLMTLVIGMVSVVIFAVLREWDAIEQNARVLREFQAIDRLVESAFRNAIYFEWNIENPSANDKPQLVFKGEHNSVYFVYRHPAAGAPPTMLRFIRIYQDGSNLVATYRNTPILPEHVYGETRNMITEVIATNVRKVEFTYAARDPENGAVNWVTSWDNEEYLEIPIAIQLGLTLEAGGNTNSEIHEVWLRRTAGNGFAEATDVRVDEYETQNKPLADLIKDRENKIQATSSGSSSRNNSGSGRTGGGRGNRGGNSGSGSGGRGGNVSDGGGNYSGRGSGGFNSGSGYNRGGSGGNRSGNYGSGGGNSGGSGGRGSGGSRGGSRR